MLTKDRFDITLPPNDWWRMMHGEAVYLEVEFESGEKMTLRVTGTLNATANATCEPEAGKSEGGRE